MITIYIILGILVIIAVLVIEYFNNREKQEEAKWNGGRCPYCDEKLEYFRTDAKGNVGYRCSNVLCSYYAWFSEEKEEE